jgi:hypothetical protein
MRLESMDPLPGDPLEQPSLSFRPSGYAITGNAGGPTPMYMPANGALLAAVAVMAAGWDGCTERAPGFPKNWKVRYEGLLPMP